MARRPRGGTQPDDTPHDFPVTPPSYADALHSSWINEALLDIQKSIGALTAKTETLASASKDHGEKLDKISHQITRAKAILAVLGFIGTVLGGACVFILGKLWDIGQQYLKTRGHLP